LFAQTGARLAALTDRRNGKESGAALRGEVASCFLANDCSKNAHKPGCTAFHFSSCRALHIAVWLKSQHALLFRDRRAAPDKFIFHESARW